MNIVNIINSKCSKEGYEGVILNEDDFHPCHPFFIDHPNIKPESADKIYIKGILEQHKYLRCVLRYCDYMLSPGGILEISFYNAHFDSPGFAVRGQNEWRYELSLVFGGRIRLIDSVKGLASKFIYTKTSPFLPSGDAITRWSFGIVSDGRKNERIMKMINTIINFRIPEFEILICGPSPSSILPENVKVLDDTPCYSDKRVPISKKKNMLIDAAQYNNLIIMHDRISFPEDWYENMCRYGNYYDLLCVPILNEKDKSKRMLDWVVSTYTTFQLDKIERFKWHHSYLEYDEWSKDIYVNGGYFQIKRHLIADVLLNPNLNWGEKEDTDLSTRLYNTGVLNEFFKGNYLTSLGVRFAGTTKTHINFFKRCKVFIGAYRRYLKENREFKKYLEQ